MVVTIGGAKKKFADIVDELHTMPPMMSQFAVWLDMKLSEYKLQGDMRLDFHESVSAPDWMKGSKCQCMERAQYGQAPRHPNNAWMYSERESAMKMMDARLLSPKQLAQHRAEFGADDLDEFDDLNDPEQLDADMAIDAQHPLVQLLSKKSKKKPTGTGKRGRPRGGKGITVTSTGVRVKRVVAKRKEPDTFPDVPKTGRDPAGPQRQEKFPSAKPQPTSGDLHQTATPKIDPKDPAFAVKQEPNQEKPKASVFPTTLPPNLQRPPSIPDLSDDELLDAFNENDDDDDCSFDSATPPDSPDNRLDRPPHQGHPPGVPTSAPNIRQAFPGQNMPPSSSSQNFRPVPQGGQVPQGYFRGAFPPQREAISTNPSQSPRQVTAPHTQTQFSQAQQQQHHQGNQPQHPAQQHQTNLGQPHTSQQQGSTPQGTPHPASSHPNSQSTPHSAASGGPALPPGHNFSQSSQSPGGTSLRLERYRQPLTTPQSLMRTPDLEDEDFMDTMDSFNDDFYDDDFGTGTDNEDIISLVSDEEAAHLAILTGSVGSPSESVPETASLPEQLSGSQPGDKSTRPVVSDPGMAGNQEDWSAPKKRKYNRKSDAIKVPKDVRLTVHNVVRDLKTQNSNLEWDFTKGLTDEWNREMNSKIVALVENRIGKVDVDTCMKAISCYYVSRKAQWRKQQGGSTEDVKKKPKSAPKAEQTDSSQTPPTQSKPPTPQP